MGELKPRIVASEMEWQITQTLEGSSPKQFDVPAGIFFGNTARPDIVRSDNTNHLSNGARHYQDVGSHYEYATPEDTRFLDGVVTNEMAGELFMIDSLARYVKANEKTKKVILSKRVIDESHTVWGYHMNLSADRDKIPQITDEHLHLYALHLATSQAMLGSGMIHQKGNTANYRFGQKVTKIFKDFGSSTTHPHERPMVNSRDESHTRDKHMRRLHVISTDPHVSPWATKMAFGTSSLVLRAIEQGYAGDLKLEPFSSVENESIARLAQKNSADLTMREKARFSNGSMYTALETQRMIIECVEKADITAEEAEILEEWKRAVDDLEHDMMRLQNRSDAIAKLALIRLAMERRDITDLSHPWLTGIDQSYGQLAIITDDDVTGEIDALKIHKDSVPYKLRSGLFAHSMPDESTWLDRVVNPPTTTRAVVRAHYVRKGAMVNWGEARYPYSNPIIMEPFDTTLPK